jgi:hypothetical protein
MRNGHVILKSGLKVKSQNQNKITIKLNCLRKNENTKTCLDVGTV